MKIAEKYTFLLNYFEQAIPVAETELNYNSPFELLVAVVLSAQCTDKRVNMVTPALFQKFPNALKLSNAAFEEIFELIKSISYPNNKARHLIGLAQMLVKDFNGNVPDTREQLEKLPGVGRKTANVILSVVYQEPTMAVDTHVFRVSKRIGIVRNAKTPLQVEQQLIKHLPKAIVPKAHHWLILHGRYTCLARSPKCNACGLQLACNFFKSKYKSSLLLKTNE